MAWKKLGPTTQAQISKILDPKETLMMASNWPDKVKRTSQWKFSAPFHYVDSDDHSDYLHSKPAVDGDAIRALVRYENVLKDKKSTAEQRKMALRFITHIIGDIHQPLHAGFHSDTGGNQVIVSFFGQQTRTDLTVEGVPDGRPINLHVVWDYNIIEEDIKRNCPNTSKDPAYIAYSKCLNDSLVINPDKTNSLSWIKESSSYLKTVYSLSNNTIDEAYYKKSVKIIRERLKLAANRLALRLEEDLADSSSSPNLTKTQEILIKVFGKEAMLFKLF
jgi:hypothetical protein